MEQDKKEQETGIVLQKSTQHDQLLQRAEAESLEFMNPKRWQMMNMIAQTFLQSGALPSTIDTAPKLMMVLQAGFEADLKPIEAINAFYFVNGRLAMYGDTCISQVKRAGHKVEWKNCNAETATCKITRGDTGESLETTFTMDMAKERGLTQGKNGMKMPWKNFPENMLKFKAFHATAKFIVPEALRGIPMKEELEDIAGEVEVIGKDGSKKKLPKESLAATQRKQPVPAKSLEEALEEPVEVMPAEEPKPTKKRVAKKEAAAKPEEKPDDGESTAAKLMKRGMNQAKEESDDEKYKRLTEEGSDRRLTQEEAKFVTEYPAKKEKSSKLL